MKETSLYEPIKAYFLEMGYKVQAEVKNCDIACMLKNELIVIEMKKSFNLKLVYQAIDRQSFADKVFVAIARPKNFKKKEVSYMIKILKALDIGLITVALDSPLKKVEIILSPKDLALKPRSRRKKAVLNELEKRNLDINKGGSTKKDKVLTAYREKAIFLVCILDKEKTISPKLANKVYGIENAGNILRDNHYGYFQKIERGVYTLSKKGKDMLKQDSFKEAIQYYKSEVKKKCLT